MPPGPPPSAYQPERRQLARDLWALRKAARLTGARLAEQAGAGWQQSKVSKIENLRIFPSEDDIRTWARVTGAGEGDLAGLLGRLQNAEVEYAAFSATYRNIGPAAMQEAILKLEVESVRIAEFQPAVIPGLAQTTPYADVLLHSPCGPAAFGATEEDIAAILEVRDRRREALRHPGKKVMFLVGEAALRYRVTPAAVLAGQLDRLADITGMPGVELGIVPFDAELPVPPFSGFRLYDSLVIVESFAGEQQLATPDEVARYERILDLLREASVAGAGAAAIIRRALTSLTH